VDEFAIDTIILLENKDKSYSAFNIRACFFPKMTQIIAHFTIIMLFKRRQTANVEIT
jgi:hypothetical protein